MADEAATIPSSAAVDLLMLPTPADLQRLAREGWFKPLAPDRWRLVDVVQGMIRSLRASRDEISAEELGKLLDVTPVRLSQLAAQGILPKNRRGYYPLTASVQANGERRRDVLTSRFSSTSLSPISAIRNRANGRLRDRTRNIALSISLLCVVAEGTGS